MKRKQPKPTSPYAALNGDDRFAAATKIAATYQLETGQVLFAYMQTIAQISAKHDNDTRLATLQPEIDEQFGKTLQLLRGTK